MQLFTGQPTGASMGRPLQAKRVLCYGHDPVLLQSRQHILQLSGCPTDVVNDEREFQRCVVAGCPGVVVLCQTLDWEECTRAVEFMNTPCPDGEVLLFFIQNPKLEPTEHCHLFQSSNSPKAFALTVFRMLYGRELLMDRLPRM